MHPGSESPLATQLSQMGRAVNGGFGAKPEAVDLEYELPLSPPQADLYERDQMGPTALTPAAKGII